MQLSPHFTSAEFDCHDGTEVPAHALSELRALCHSYLEPLRRRYGAVVVISGYRTRRYNSQVGGAVSSYHIYLRRRWGVAADVRARHGDAEDWHRFLSSLNPGGLGRYPSGHVHVDNRIGHARW